MMESVNSCCCCLLRPSEKDLKRSYICLGNPVVYADLLEKCFQIQLILSDNECGICDECVGRLQDASDFKLQVQCSQAELQARLESARLDQDNKPMIKSEIDDGDGDAAGGGRLDDWHEVKSECSEVFEEHGADEMLDEPAKISGDESIDDFDGDIILLPQAGPSSPASERAQCVSARAREQLAMSCSVRLERLRDDAAPRACPACLHTFEHEASLATHVRDAHGDGCGAKDEEETYTFEHKASLTTHMRDAHGDGCGARDEGGTYTFEHKASLTTQMRVHAEHETELIQEIQNNPPESLTKNTKFICDTCLKIFTRKSRLIKHMQTHIEKNTRPTPCKSPKEPSKDPRNRQKSLTHFCKVCNKQFSLQSDFDVHKCVNTSVKPYRCKVCFKRFTSKRCLKLHRCIILTNNELYSCEFCFKKFTRIGHLTRHRIIHTGEKPFRCEVCDKRFTQKSSLTGHQRVHTGEKPFRCDQCDKQFRRRFDLLEHKRKHAGAVRPSYTCDICKKQLVDRIVLIRHLKTHSGQKPYTCELCFQKFSHHSSLKRHRKRVHEKKKEKKEQKEGKKRKIKTVSCNYCTKKYASNTALAKHQICHTGVKRYSCTVCDKKFFHSSGLSQHTPIHIGEKPHSCKICFKKFSRSGHLRRHFKIHTGEKSYSCEVCGEKFLRSESLRAHEKVHAKIRKKKRNM